MTRSLAFFVVAALSVGLSGCQNSDSPIQVSANDNTEDQEWVHELQDFSSIALPADQAADEIRNLESETFNFQVTRNIPMTLAVEVMGFDGAVSPEESVIVSVFSPADDLLYRGAIGENVGVASLASEVMVHGGWDNLIVHVDGNNVLEREVTLDNVSNTASFDRTLFTRLAEPKGWADSDGDHVPDPYDNSPNLPETAFFVNLPPASIAPFDLAFEDLFPSLGDYDFNDFHSLSQYSMQLTANGDLFEVRFVAVAQTRGAGHDHSLRVVLAGVPNQNYQLIRSSSLGPDFGINENGTFPANGFLDIEVIPSTKEAFGNSGRKDNVDPTKPRSPSSSWQIVLRFPDALASGGGTLTQMENLFDPYLLDLNTGYDIHLMGKTSRDGSTNPPDTTFVDENGHPWAILVPRGFRPPLENVDIREAYPHFNDWVASKGVVANDWYAHPDPTKIIPAF